MTSRTRNACLIAALALLSGPPLFAAPGFIAGSFVDADAATVSQSEQALVDMGARKIAAALEVDPDTARTSTGVETGAGISSPPCAGRGLPRGRGAAA